MSLNKRSVFLRSGRLLVMGHSLCPASWPHVWGGRGSHVCSRFSSVCVQVPGFIGRNTFSYLDDLSFRSVLTVPLLSDEVPVWTSSDNNHHNGRMNHDDQVAGGC